MILIGTQVLEESIDIDGDILFTDLAPIDKILQRGGRIWRYNNIIRGVKEPIINVFTPGDISEENWEQNKKDFGWTPITKFIYHEYLLLKTYFILHNLEYIDVVADSRRVVDELYWDEETIEWLIPKRAKWNEIYYVLKNKSNKHLHDNLLRCIDDDLSLLTPHSNEEGTVITSTRNIVVPTQKVILVQDFSCDAEVSLLTMLDGSIIQIDESMTEDPHLFKKMKEAQLFILNNSIKIYCHEFIEGWEGAKKELERIEDTSFCKVFGTRILPLKVDRNRDVISIANQEILKNYSYNDMTGFIRK
jgi:hypothetical protein